MTSTLGVDYLHLLDAFPDAVVAADLAGRIVYLNPAAENLLGWKADELIGRTLHAIQPPRMHAAHDHGFRRYVETRRPRLIGRPVRLPARRRDGEEIDVELNLACVATERGGELLLGVIRDLSERVELERQLRLLRYLRATSAAASRLSSLLEVRHVVETVVTTLVDDFDAALARIWIFEPDEKILRLAASGGLSTETARSSRARIDPATHPYKIGVVARTRRPFVQNGLAGDPDFDQSWIEREGIEAVACFPLLAGDHLLGVLVHFTREPLPDEMEEVLVNFVALASAALHDARLVDAERTALEASRAAHRRLLLIAEASGALAGSMDYEATLTKVARLLIPEFCDWCLVDVVDAEGGIDALVAAHRDPDKEALIAELRANYPPDRDEPHPIHAVIESGEPSLEQEISEPSLEARARDARHLHLLRELGTASHIVVPLRARDRIIGALSFVSGPDGRRYDRDDLATAIEIGRTAGIAIDNARLYSAAQQAAQLREEFLSVAAHELRTPTTVVQAYWQILERLVRRSAEAQGPTEQIVLDRAQLERALTRIGAGIERLRVLVLELLDITRLQRGLQSINLTETDLCRVVQEAVERARQVSMGDSAVSIVMQAPQDPIRGVWDPSRLGQVLDNLLENAVKYSPRGGVIRVQLSRADDGGAHLSVQDDGIGVPREEAESIFQPFMRGSNAAARHFVGFGMGLALSRDIVQRMGGRLWVESPGDGLGSTFHLLLPRVQA